MIDENMGFILHAKNVKCVSPVESYSSSDLWTLNAAAGFRDAQGGAEIEVNYEIFSFSVRFQPGMKAREEDVRALQTKRDSGSYDCVLQNSAVDLFLNERLKLLPGNSTAVQYLSRRTSSWN